MYQYEEARWESAMISYVGTVAIVMIVIRKRRGKSNTILLRGDLLYRSQLQPSKKLGICTSHCPAFQAKGPACICRVMALP